MAEQHKNSGQGTQAAQGQSNQGNQQRGNQNQGNGGQGNANKGGQQNQGSSAVGVAQMARETASSVAHGASDLMHSAAEQAGHAADSVAGGVRSLAGSLREHAPSQGMLGSAAGSVADTLEGSTRYLQEGGFGHMLDDVSGAIRRNPIPCMLCTLAFGFVLGRLLHSSSADSSRSY
jgi:hypothetical protein